MMSKWYGISWLRLWTQVQRSMAIELIMYMISKSKQVFTETFKMIGGLSRGKDDKIKDDDEDEEE